ncbi:ABC transporter ATP-binding protein [Crassaminicella profunda]|uniref:ABC transporter ATP-binding protein n=1 Tax=Crassaminicella profunda TaxID=1286698 RepID=UPI001CA72BD5|nr:ABC transporter ATP-binding protein/permease [Crassaminicella profunda]
MIFSIVPYYCIYRIVTLFYQSNYQVKNYILGAVIGIILRFVCFFISSYISHEATADLLYGIRLKILKKLEQLSLGGVTQKNSGYYKKLIVEDVENLERFLAHHVPEVSSSLGVPILVAILLFILDWRLAIATIGIIPIAYKILSGMMTGSQEKMENYSTSLMNMNFSIIEYIQGMTVIKSFNKTDASTVKIDQTVDTFKYYVLDWYKSCWRYMSGFAVLIKANLFILLPTSGVLLLRGDVDISTVMFFFLMSFSFSVPLVKLGEFTDTMPMINQSFEKVRLFLEEEEMENSDCEVKFENYSIEFKNVSFSYTESQQAVKNMSFRAEEGGLTALVGKSGCGKSTIAKLSARFWDVDTGEILIGGIPIKKIPIQQLMDNISFVFQDTIIFNDTLRNNIRMGKPDATDREIMEAAKLASCGKLVTEKGLDRIVGGVNNKLSGGEKQRIAIARAILKNSPIIILDEATASSDAENQMEIQRAISNLSKNKTVLTIAHRLSTIVDANKIVVLSKGEKVEEGKHSKLMENTGLYKTMYKKYEESLNFKISTKEVR